MKRLVTNVSATNAHLTTNASHINIWIDSGRRDGGDAWVASTQRASGEIRRTVALDYGNGTYSAHLFRDDATDVPLQLWWSASSDRFLEDQWIQSSSARSLAQKSFGCRSTECCCQIECVARQVARWRVPPPPSPLGPRRGQEEGVTRRYYRWAIPSRMGSFWTCASMALVLFSMLAAERLHTTAYRSWRFLLDAA